MSPSELELVAPVWASLLEHHGEVEPRLPTRPASQSWPMRRRDYERWLAEPDSFALVAEEDGVAVGYAVVHLQGPDETWESNRPRLGRAQPARTGQPRMSAASRLPAVGATCTTSATCTPVPSESVGARRKDFTAPDAPR